jgi:glycosyltransferase involved in cell wall biosynthesis
VLLEAASCGRAIVATDVPGCREIVEHGINGLLVPPKDVNSLAESMLNWRKILG